MRPRRSEQYQNSLIWPGFVDALSTLLLVVIFLLMIFFLGQFFLQVTLSGQNKTLELTSDKLKKTELSLKQKNKILSSNEQKLIDLQSLYIGKTLDLKDEQETNDKKSLSLKNLNEAKNKLVIQISQLLALKAKYKTELDRFTAEKIKNLSEQDKLKLSLKKEQDISLLLTQEIDSAKISMLKNTKIYFDDKANFLIKIGQLEKNLKKATEQLNIVTSNLNFQQQNKAEKDKIIDDLTHQLNIALSDKLASLSKYRSDFFGRLREILGDDHNDISIVGDRFVFQSEVLFQSGSAELEYAGQEQLQKLSFILLDISKQIPLDIPWILRVDGHTDILPIATEEFPSNWELSQARALSVVRFLISQGIPEGRLAATGFGQFHPLDMAENNTAYHKNRRIELKLTGR